MCTYTRVYKKAGKDTTFYGNDQIFCLKKHFFSHFATLNDDFLLFLQKNPQIFAYVKKLLYLCTRFCENGSDMVVLAQLVEHRIVVPSVVGSSPTFHPGEGKN